MRHKDGAEPRQQCKVAARVVPAMATQTRHSPLHECEWSQSSLRSKQARRAEGPQKWPGNRCVCSSLSLTTLPRRFQSEMATRPHESGLSTTHCSGSLVRRRKRGQGRPPQSARWPPCLQCLGCCACGNPRAADTDRGVPFGLIAAGVRPAAPIFPVPIPSREGSYLTSRTRRAWPGPRWWLQGKRGSSSRCRSCLRISTGALDGLRAQ